MADTTPTSVYKFYDEYGVLIYVGITSRGLKRQSEHNKGKSWWPYVASQEIEHHACRGDALAREESLIASHEPPFNTQHNPRHAEASASYTAFRSLPSLDMSPIDLMRESGMQIPLIVVDSAANMLRLATPMKFATVIPALSVSRAMRCISGTARCGALMESVQRGPSLDLVLNVRAGVDVDAPFMRVKTIMTKSGAHFEGKNIQLG